MTPDQRKTSLLVVAAISCGWIGWSGSILLLPLSAAFPFLWSRAAGRASAALISAGYFLAASRGLPQGVANFYQSDLWPGLLLWLVASSSFVLVHAALWTRHEGRRLGIRSVAAMILMAVPPFGIVGWAHPVTAAGVLFPGLGWAGLAAMATGLTVMVTRYWPAAAVALAGCWLWSAAFWTPPEIERGWHGVDLYMGSKLGRDGSLAHHRDLVATVRQIEQAKGDVVVLPESALGLWTPTLESRWQRELQSGRHAVIAGAAVVTEAGYDNVLVHISGSSAEVVYRERMPVPGSMWQPWRRLVGESVGAQAHFFDNPVAAIGGKKVAPLICYEQLIVWPILQSMLHEPELILAVGNGWWTTGTKIVAIQRMSVEAWARLFDKPFVMSFNT
ncbi:MULTISPECIES: conjugal transfer protein TraB [Agrobacterium]|uniref:conjugal transfer protein TraB n=1 Tax=Agrobacterium tumefaciens TaxID=358 RepID=UPI000EF1998F|nr:conjugal transfer protein TraB [Agrobacterium tumefaciens]NSY09757.1 conjugal transfer protein TraB [Agrobacterium tumefaciens]NSY93386.1 conjugal transfer protein TraB [Agrobacterium tumefaciens]